MSSRARRVGTNQPRSLQKGNEQPANQQKREGKESDELQHGTGYVLKPSLQIKGKKSREDEHRPRHHLGGAIPRQKLLRINPPARHQRLLRQRKHNMPTGEPQAPLRRNPGRCCTISDLAKTDS